ncbi:MAG: LuxR C-terminal-related transcriptional regulator [bacterium]|nr:LuxR C-terminal-related transcriptional regulator [bacterium]
MSDSSMEAAAPLRLPLVRPVQPAEVIGREAELAAVEEMFRAGARVVVVSGIAGIGKSALAAEAAGPEGTWVSLAENSAGGAPTSARSIMAALLGHWGRDPGADVEEAFAEASNSHPGVVVLDDVREPSEVRRVTASAPGSRFIITTRAAFPSHPRHEAALELGGLDHAAAGALLAERGVPLGTAIEEETVRTALDLLAGHPLALGLFAGAVARRPGWSIEDHVARLAGAGGDELADSLTSLHASIDDVGEAVRALRLLAHVPRGRIDMDLAAAYLGEDHRFLDELAAAGLVAIADGNVRIHDVVAHVARRDSAREDRPGWVAGRLQGLTAAVLERLTAAVLGQNPRLKETIEWIPEDTEPMGVDDSAQWFETNLPLVLALADSARAAGDHRTFLRMAQMIGFWGADSAQSSTLLDICRMARHVAEQHGSQIDRYYAERLLGRALERLGRWAEARRAHQGAVESALALGDRTLEARARYGVASTNESLGNLSESLREFDLICSIFEDGDPKDLARALAGTVVIRWRVGDFSRSIAAGKRALALLDGTDRVATGMTHSNLVEPHLFLGDVGGARHHAEAARSFVASVGSALLDSFVDCQFALLTAIDGDLPASEDAFDRVSATAREIAAPFLLAQSENYRGMARLRAGDVTGAGTAFRRALDVPDAYEGDRLLAQAGLEAASGGRANWRGHLIWVTPPAPSRDSSWSLLTAREFEVAELVADGWRDSEIARTLVLSPRTVESHVASIRRKLAVTTRAGIGRALAS